MCGLFGSVGYDVTKLNSWARNNLEALKYRGPDSSGFWEESSNDVLLGHTRLAIIDLSNNASQPFHRPDLGISVIFNGEIYNYREIINEIKDYGIPLNTKSDTEVIAVGFYLWGNDLFKRLVGMFATAIYNQELATITLARDIAGEKPLYYTHTGGRFVFGSTLDTVIGFPGFKKEIDQNSLIELLSNGFVTGENSLVSGVKKLSSGTCLTLNIKTRTITRNSFWDIPSYDIESKSIPQIESDVSKFDRLLQDAVTRQMEADVDVGVLLSGGLDSSLVAAKAANHKDLKAFHLAISSKDGAEESRHAQMVCDAFDLKLINVPGDVNEIINHIETILGCYDEPVFDSSILPTWLVTREMRKYCKVAIGGDGADELFGGYRHYDRVQSLRNFSYLSWPVRGLSRMVSPLLQSHIKGMRYVGALGCDLNKEFPVVVAYFNKREIKKLVPNIKAVQVASHIKKFDECNSHDLIQQMTRYDFKNYLQSDILVKVDRASMSNSLELRAPFLDKNMVEFAFGQLSSERKVFNGKRKIIMQEAADLILPTGFNKSRKVGFSIPINEWFSRGGKLRPFVESVLLNPDSLFCKLEIHNLLNKLDRGERLGEKLFGLMQIEWWRNKHGL